MPVDPFSATLAVGSLLSSVFAGRRERRLRRQMMEEMKRAEKEAQALNTKVFNDLEVDQLALGKAAAKGFAGAGAGAMTGSSANWLRHAWDKQAAAMRENRRAEAAAKLAIKDKYTTFRDPSGYAAQWGQATSNMINTLKDVYTPDGDSSGGGDGGDGGGGDSGGGGGGGGESAGGGGTGRLPGPGGSGGSGDPAGTQRPAVTEPREGDRKVEGGRTRVYRNGRWALARSEAPPKGEGSGLVLPSGPRAPLELLGAMKNNKKTKGKGRAPKEGAERVVDGERQKYVGGKWVRMFAPMPNRSAGLA